MKKNILVVGLLCVLSFMTACNGYSVATTAQKVIGAVLQVAVAEEPAIPPADQPAYTSFVGLAQTLDSQLGTCINTANSGMSKSAKFLACFNAFAAGLNTPGELAALRVTSPSTQSKAELYIVAVITGVNVAVAAFGGTPATAPTVAAVQPSQDDLRSLAAQAHIDSRLLVFVQ